MRRVVSEKDTAFVNSVGANDLHITARFSKDETVTRGIFEKSYLHSDYPVVTIDLLGSLKGIGKNEYSYFRSEVSMDYKLKLPPVGASRIKLTAGKIVGTVPYPMLKLHEGNGTYILDQSSFSCMEFMNLLPIRGCRCSGSIISEVSSWVRFRLSRSCIGVRW